MTSLKRLLFLLFSFFVLIQTSNGQVPTFSSFSPGSGAIGSTVTIQGTNFSSTAANNIVYFGATKAVVSSATSTVLSVVVPLGATYKPITVTVNGLSCYSSKPFVVTFASNRVLDGQAFAPRVVLGTASLTNEIALGDIDRDGLSDIITSSTFFNEMDVLRNSSLPGAIAFDARVIVPTDEAPRDISVADLDGDGKLDLVTANSAQNSVSLSRNISSPGSILSTSFEDHLSLTTGTAPDGVHIRDLNADGKADIVTTKFDNSLSLIRNVGTPGTFVSGGFNAHIDIATDFDGGKMAVGDLDGDGKPDLVVTHFNSSNSISVFRNVSTTGTFSVSSFSPQVDFSVGQGATTSPSIADIDDDGKPDIVVVNSDDMTISILRNTSTSGTISASSFAGKVDFATAGSSTGLAIGDLDGDGKVDMVVTNNFVDKISLFQNTTTPGTIDASSFAARADLDDVNLKSRIAIGDLDNDGKPDLVVVNLGNGTVSVFRNVILPPPPIISDFSPADGAPGTVVTITGTDFGLTSDDNVVKFNGVIAAITAVTSTSITVTVPTNVSTGPVTVTANSQTASSVNDFVILPPTISDVSPLIGYVGTSVTIIGANFGLTPEDNLVKFNGTVAVITSCNTTSITTSVPPGATTGLVTITTNAQTAASADDFTILYPAITSFHPVEGEVGTVVTITGTHFSAVPGDNLVKFNETASVVTASTNASITTSVPAGATTGTIKITVAGQTAASANEFTVLIITGDLHHVANGSVNLFPNPSKDDITIDLKEMAMGVRTEIHVYDMTGRLIERAWGESGSELHLNISSYANGIYLVNGMQNGRTWTKKFLKK